MGSGDTKEIYCSRMTVSVSYLLHCMASFTIFQPVLLIYGTVTQSQVFRFINIVGGLKTFRNSFVYLSFFEFYESANSACKLRNTKEGRSIAHLVRGAGNMQIICTTEGSTSAV